MVKEIHLLSPSTRNVFSPKAITVCALLWERWWRRQWSVCLVLQKELMEAELFLCHLRVWSPETGFLGEHGWDSWPPVPTCFLVFQCFPYSLSNSKDQEGAAVSLLLPVCSAPMPQSSSSPAPPRYRTSKDLSPLLVRGWPSREAEMDPGPI